MTQKVVPISGTKKLILSYVVPKDYSSPTYNQKIVRFDLDFSVSPTEREEEDDDNGNHIIRATWKEPSQEITSAITITARNSTRLVEIKTVEPFPLNNLPKDVERYLKSTEQVPAKNDQIIAKARALTEGSKTEFDAVQKVLTWVIDHMKYVLLPESYDAMYSFKTGKGNCQNYSHLTAALLRAVGIPARIVNGVTLKQPYDVKVTGGVLTMRRAQGRLSWIEVFFPDLGWVPFDPQQTQLYVSNRFIRVEVGLDNNETKYDGLIRWTESKGASGLPQFEENIDANFASDFVQLLAEKQNYGPRELLFSPRVVATFTKPPIQPPPPPPTEIPKKTVDQMELNKPFVFGNLEFPENVDFISGRGPAQSAGESDMEMRKNFLVETAEYVTTQGKQYAQTFILQNPVKLGKIGLALHKFGGDGQLWVEIYKDNGGGMPGELLSSSDFIELSRIPYSAGYAWVDFGFSQPDTRLAPGRYWIAFGFTGSPIVNWFFTYGKPIGPIDGTRYKTILDDTWSRSLSFEFNYRVVGWTSN